MQVTRFNAEYGSVDNTGRNEMSDLENESEPFTADILEKRTALAFKVLQFMGLTKGERSRKLGRLFILVVAVMTCLPPTSLSICVAKNPTMASPSGLPTVLLFSGLAISHLFFCTGADTANDSEEVSTWLSSERTSAERA